MAGTIGDTLRPELLRSDTSGILHGGLATGRSAERGLSEFGKAIAMGKREMDAKKQKRRDDEEMAQAIQRFDPSLSPEDASALARNKNLRDWLDRSREQDRLDQQAQELSDFRRFQTKALEDAQTERELQRQGQRQFLTRITEERLVQKPDLPPLTPEGMEEATRLSESPEAFEAFMQEREAPVQEWVPPIVEDPSSQAFYNVAGELTNPYAQQLALDTAAAQRAIELEARKFEMENLQSGYTPGMRKVDEEFAKGYNEFIAQGGMADVDKMLGQLEAVSAALATSDDLTGPVIGLFPEIFGKRVNPEAAAVKAAVEEVVQRNLRLILGAQFTEKEGTRLIERAFDPSLEEAENKKRVDGLIKQIKDAARTKLAAGQYFEQRGTLAGFPGIASMREIQNGRLPESGVDGPGSDEEEKRRLLEVYDKESGGGGNVNTPVPVPAAPQGLWQRRGTVWDNTFGQPVNPLL
jgi:hypothetical protein